MGNSKSVQRPPKPDIFFTVPLEIRRAIYAYVVPQDGVHLFPSKDVAGLRLTNCFDPALSSHDYGLEREGPLQRCFEDRLWQRRLLSPWGPHWRCEEETEQGSRGGPLLDVCRTTRLEYAQILAEQATFEIISLHDLAALSGSLTRPQPELSISSLIVPNLVYMSITLYMPFRLLRDFNGSTYTPWVRPPKEITTLLSLWSSYADILATFPKLRYLRLWADHDEPNSWTTSHEQLVIESIKKLVIPREVDGVRLERLDLYLPQIYPDEGRTIDWGGEPDLEVVVRHVARQRYRVRNNAAGQPVIYYVDEQPPVPEHPVSLLSLQQISHIQASEARMWD